MSLTGILTFIGGVGLFLLGMRMMTDGLKIAAGDTLQAILSAATRSRLRGLASGVLITAVVQASAAVIFATIGFVNAGLLSLTQAVGIVFGANLGSTFTSWIVALLGFNLDLQALAMPAIGLGMGLWIAFSSKPKGALGQALAGFGLFFLGIDVLRDALADIGDVIALESWAGQGMASLLLFALIGTILTILMSSSGAALAVTLTAAAGGLIPLTAAAAMVIGANVGTTSTAVLAAIGATAPAKRVASAHVLFNVITAIVAFVTLPLLLWLMKGIAGLLGFSGQIAAQLALFHTMTKVLGIAIMWPLTGWMVRFLEARFRSLEEDQSHPHFLDTNIVTTPSLAMDALILELKRMGELARELGREAISAEATNSARMVGGQRILEKLNVEVSEFASGIARHAGDSQVSDLLPDALRVSHYLGEIAESATEIAGLHSQVILEEPHLAEARNLLFTHTAELLSHTRVEEDVWNAALLHNQREHFEKDYQSLKAQLLRAGTDDTLKPRRMAALLEELSALHRMVDQATKSALYLERVICQHHGSAALVEEEMDEQPPEPVDDMSRGEHDGEREDQQRALVIPQQA